MTVTHHDLCFGCGVANLFGLQLEASIAADEGLSGRFFVKQDHQGPPGVAHGGIVTTALDEAMALLVHGMGILALTRRIEVDLIAPTPVGAFADVRAWFDARGDLELVLGADLAADGRVTARARGAFARMRDAP